ncbi:MAG TPA: CpsB/CapC family capsule biosynthesis tyrosine phosphatase [Kofleriaceae bacterium]|jgi:protein-tyrosine phosphatase|nr:CpsB/CapC family capsule biosynthesis tyrosine phosphatase [Kofleriaceae bacterium]
MTTIVRRIWLRYTRPPVGYVDLHSHVLYGLDDGAPNEEIAIAMLDGLAALGISEQCVTPHQKAGQFLPAWDQVEATLAKLDAIRRPHHPTLRLGAENMWDDVFFQRLTDGVIPHYANTPAFLVEIRPSIMPPNMIDVLFKLRMAGKVPVLAHPERYHALWDDDELASQLRRCCAFVIDLGAIAGFHGRRETKQARHLLERGFATAVATDAHQLGDLQQASAGLAWIDKKLGHAAVARLFDHAPRQLLAGELPD